MHRKQTNPIYYFFVILLVTSSIGTVFAAPDIPVYTVEESSPQCSFEEAIWNSSIAPWLLAMQKLETYHANRPGMTSIKDYDAMWQTEKNKKSSALNAIINQDIKYSYKKKEPDQQIKKGALIECYLNDLKTNISTGLTSTPERNPTSLLHRIDAFDLSLIDSAHLLLAIDEIGQALIKFSKQENKNENIDTIKALDYINKITEQNNKLCHTVIKFIASLEKESAADKVAALNSIDSETLTSHKYFARFIGVVKKSFTKISKEEINRIKIENLQQKIQHLTDRLDNNPINFNGKIVWKIADFERKRQQAIAKEKVQIISPPFFGKDGRKFEAILFLNGIYGGEDTHLTFAMKAKKNDLSSLLHWPCIGLEVTFVLYNQNNQIENKQNFSEGFKTTKDTVGFFDPINDKNLATGKTTLIPLSELEEPSKYIKDNSIIISVEIKDPEDSN